MNRSVFLVARVLLGLVAAAGAASGSVPYPPYCSVLPEGRVILDFAAGGCIPETDHACVIRAEGVVIRDFRNVKSPDFDGAGGNHVVDLSDLEEFNRERGSGGCHDYDNNGVVDLRDLVIFASGFSPGHHCP
jgi:hypothetical protein